MLYKKKKKDKEKDVTQRVCGFTVWMGFFFLQCHAVLQGGAGLQSVELQVEGGGEEGVQGAGLGLGLGLGEGTDFGDGLG